MDHRYTAIVRKATDSDYGVEFPDFPGCVTAGRTPEEAADLAGEALALHIRGMLADGVALPEPTPAEEVYIRAAGDEKAALIFVTPEPPSHTVRANITIDENLLRAADGEARRRGTTRSGLIAELLRHAVRH